MANSRGHQVKYTQVFLLAVPAKMRDGVTLEELAQSVGGTAAALRQTCRKYNIELPRKATRFSRDGKVRTFLRVKQSSVEAMQKRARLLGMSYTEMLEKLVETIVKDDLYLAVLGDGDESLVTK